MSRIYFAKTESLSRKLSIFLIFAVIYAFGLYFYKGYENVRSSFKSYYIKSYVAAATLGLDQLLSKASNTLLGAHNYVSSEIKANSVPVLLYHGILNESDGSNVTLANFKDQMVALKNAGYETISIEELHDFLNGRGVLPHKPFMVSFDDGRKDSYYPASPILEALGFKAVMFAIADYSLAKESSYYLTSKEIQKMAQSGTWQIESHTSTHHDLTTEPDENLPDEILGSRQKLENLTGKPIIAFAYPFGDFGQNESTSQLENNITQAVESAYKLSFYQSSGNNRFTQNYPDIESSNHTVKRIGVKPEWSGQDLLQIIESGTAKPLPFEARFDKTDGWVDTLWGKVELGSKLQLRSLPDSTGSAAILDGTRLWKDYTITANVRVLSGSNFYLWARYVDDNNYVACNFGRSLLHLETSQNGVKNVIRGSNIEAIPLESFTAGMQVRGREVTCLVNGKPLVTTEFLDESLNTGGIGVKTWDKTPGNSTVDVTSLSVNSI